MVMVWFGNVLIFHKVEFPTVLIYVTSEKIRKKAWGQHRRARYPWLGTSANYIGPFSTNSLISMGEADRQSTMVSSDQ
jgi:hypothetical protein